MSNFVNCGVTSFWVVDFFPRTRRQIQTGDFWIGRVSATAEPSCPAKLKNTSSKFEHFSRWIGLGAKKKERSCKLNRNEILLLFTPFLNQALRLLFILLSNSLSLTLFLSREHSSLSHFLTLSGSWAYPCWIHVSKAWTHYDP